jgi:acetyltransferase-like isoleucine patch superfamily enzyme
MGDSQAFRAIGEIVTIYPLAKLLGRETISIGSHVIIDDFVFVGAHREIVIGNYVHIASHSSITGGGRCVLHDFAGISGGVRILTGSDNFSGESLTNPTIPAAFRRVDRGEVVLESHVIVGANAVVLPNVRIGEGAAVAAGSIVTRDLEPWGIYAGSPARRVKARPEIEILRQEEQLYLECGRPSCSYRSPIRRSHD